MAGIRISALNTVNLQPEDKFPVARSGNTYAVEGRELLDRFSDLDSRIQKLSGDTSVIDNSELSAMPAFSVKANQFNESAQPQDLRATEANTILMRPPTGFMTFGKLSSDFIDGTIATNKGGTGQSSYSEGQLLIGNTSGSLSKNTLTQGDRINIQNGNGSITISASATNLSTTYSASKVDLNSSTGTSTEILSASTTRAGVMTALDKTKLDGIASGAEVNVQANWTETNTASDAFILNKPSNATQSVAGFMSAADKTKLDGIANNANNYVHPNHSGDVTSAGDGATTIINNAVSNAKLSDMAASTLKGRITSTGDPQDLTAAQVRTLLNVADGANNYVHPNHSGDVTSAGDGATTIVANAISNTKLRDSVALSVIGRSANSTGDPADIAGTANQVLRVNNAGTSLGFGALNLAGDAAVTGTLPITHGGTGQTSFTNGQLLIGDSSGNTLNKATLTPGAGIGITNGAGSITIANAGVTKILSGTNITISPSNGLGNVTIDVSNTLLDEINSQITTIGNEVLNLSIGCAKAFVNFDSNSSTASVNYFTPGTYTWTAPTGVTQINLTVVAGGGGGGGGAAGTYGGSGGGGGAVYVNSAFPVVAGQSYTVVVGAGGLGGARYEYGSSGQQSKFGTSITANGGGGGGSGQAGMSYPVGLAGGSGATSGSAGNFAGGGSGGSSFRSGGVPQGGSALPNSGGGGAGGQYGYGGNGGSGRVMITYSSPSAGVSLIDAYNVNSVTRNSQGIFTINFTPGTFSDANYTYVGTARETNTTGSPATVSPLSNSSKTSTSLRIAVREDSNNLVDSSEICIVCFNKS